MDGMESLKGEFYLAHNTKPTVYVWKRSTQYLYVGLTTKFLGRLGHHNIINVVEPVLSQDSIFYKCFSTYQKAVAFEEHLIATKNPKYNTLGLSELEQDERRNKSCKWLEANNQRLYLTD
jgi:predicted GIY-YIG superfamily endonuclease